MKKTIWVLLCRNNRVHLFEDEDGSGDSYIPCLFEEGGNPPESVDYYDLALPHCSPHRFAKFTEE